MHDSSLKRHSDIYVEFQIQIVFHSLEFKKFGVINIKKQFLALEKLLTSIFLSPHI